MDTSEAIRSAQADLAALPARNVEALRRIRKKISKRLQPLPGSVVKDVGFAVWRSGPRWVAYELLAEHEAALTSLTIRDIEALGDGMATWEEVDDFGVILAGAAWRCGAIGDADVRRWAKSDNLWWRRAALVSTVVLNTKSRGGVGDAKRTLMVCALLAGDGEEMVVKALSRALRALAAWDEAAVEAFVAEHGKVLAARVKRDVRSKLKTGVKPGKRGTRGG